MVSWYHSGKRDRWYFKSKALAESKCSDLIKSIRHEGAEGVLFGAKARYEYATAKQILEPFDCDLVEAARFYTSKHEILISSKKWDFAVLELCKSLELSNRRPRTIANIKRNLDSFKKFTEAETLADFNFEDVRAFLTSGNFKPATVCSYRASLSNFGNFAVRRGWLKFNPVEKIKPPTLDRGNPVVYTIREANRLLTEAAKLYDGRIIRRLALLLLCGLRPTEIDHLKAEDFRKDGIRVGAGKIRGRRSVRFLPYSLSFLAWWESFPGEIKPANFRKIYEQAKRNAGITKRGTKIERHTWISARLAVLQDENRVAREAGNSPEVIYNDYFQLIDENEAKQLGAYCTIDRLTQKTPI